MYEMPRILDIETFRMTSSSHYLRKKMQMSGEWTRSKPSGLSFMLNWIIYSVKDDTQLFTQYHDSYDTISFVFYLFTNATTS